MVLTFTAAKVKEGLLKGLAEGTHACFEGLIGFNLFCRLLLNNAFHLIGRTSDNPRIYNENFNLIGLSLIVTLQATFIILTALRILRNFF